MIIRKMAKKICQKMLGVNMLAAVIVCSSSANGAISVTASRDYVDRKISVVSNQLERIESRTNDWNSAIQGIKVNGGEPIEATDNIVDISVPVAGTSLPLIADIADAGISNEYSRVDHTHPAETKVIEYVLPTNCFPITYEDIFLPSGQQSCTIASNAGIRFEFVSANNIVILHDIASEAAGGYDYGFSSFSASTLKWREADALIVSLKFNNTAPTENTWPVLEKDAVFVRDVQVVKPSDIPVTSVNGNTGAVQIDASDVGAVPLDGTTPMTGALDTPGIYIAGHSKRFQISEAIGNLGVLNLTDGGGVLFPNVATPDTLALVSQIYTAVQQIAPKWVANSTNKVNSLVSYQGTVYQNTSGASITNAIPPNRSGSGWTAKPVSELFLPITGGEMTGNLILGQNAYIMFGQSWDVWGDATKLAFSHILGTGYVDPQVAGNGWVFAALQNIAGNFSTTKVYAENDLVVYDNSYLGRGKLYRCTTEHQGDWDANHFTVATVQDVLSALNESLGDTIKGVKINGNDVQVTNQVANIAMNTVDIDGSIETQYPEVLVKSGLSAGHSYTFTHQTTTAANQRYTRGGFSMSLLDYMDSGGADSTYFQSYATINKLAMYLSRASNVNARLLVRERGNSTDLFSSDEFTIDTSLSLVTITFPAEAKFDLDKRYDFWFVQSGTTNILDNVSIYTEVNYAVPNFEIMSANGTRYSLNNECFRGNSIIKVGYDIDIAKKSDVSNIDAYIDDLSRCYTEWKEPLADNSQSGGSNQIFITPSAFGATTNCTVRSIVIKTSSNAGQIPNRIVYAKLRDNSTGNTLCVSRPVYIGSAGVEYKFIFDGEFSLAHNKQYRIDFESALNNAVNVAVRLSDEQTENQGIYYGSYLKRRPIIKVLYSDETFEERYYTKEEVDIAVSTATPSDYDAVRGQVNTNTTNIANNAANITAQWQACTEAFADRYYTEISTNSTTGVVSTNNYGALYGNANMLTGNVEFVSAVKAVPITPDPDDAAELSEYGTYGSVGAAILGLIAAAAALKRKKLDGDSAAPAWVSGTAYAANTLCSYNGVVYQNTSGSTIQSATTPDTSGSGWEAKKVSELFLTKLDSEAAAPDYDSTATYAEGEYVTYLGKLYYAKQAITTAEDWTPAHWQEDRLAPYIKTFTSAITALSQRGYVIDNNGQPVAVFPDGTVPQIDGYPLRYSMLASVALTATNDEATLVLTDRAVTNATIATGFSTLNLTFPTEISGKVRDFYMRITVAAGESAPAMVLPQGITAETPDGSLPAIADGATSAASTTIVYFSETSAGTFIVKSETVTTVASAA